jgi:single-stranded DNA-binding protein
MVNESNFSVTGYIATDPVLSQTQAGVPTLSMRLGWTPRKLNRSTGEWADQASSFATVKCYRSLAQNGRLSLHKGDPVVVSGALNIREYADKDGNRRTAVDVTATAIGHDLSRGIAEFSRLRRPGPAADEAGSSEVASPAAGGDTEPDGRSHTGPELDGVGAGNSDLGLGPGEPGGADAPLADMPDSAAELEVPQLAGAPF